MLLNDRYELYVVFFKLNSSSELHISDWSSDLCSSDLHHVRHSMVNPARLDRAQRSFHILAFAMAAQLDQVRGRDRQFATLCRRDRPHRLFDRMRSRAVLGMGDRHDAGGNRRHLAPMRARHRRQRRVHVRSEEHTSELQSLMRISYAVFCLKKKTTE